MKKISITCFLLFFLITGTLIAQTSDTIPARMVIDEGTKGDIILGKENMKKQLTETPQLIHQKDSIQKKETFIQSKKKKFKHRKCCKSE